MAGQKVLEAGTVSEALQLMDHRRPDILVTSLDVPPEGGVALLNAIRSRSGTSLPVIALTELDPHDVSARQDSGGGFEAYQSKFDSEALVRSVERLAAAVAAAEGETLEAAR
jgi:CheY-like chemotaxis protein